MTILITVILTFYITLFLNEFFKLSWKPATAPVVYIFNTLKNKLIKLNERKY